VTLCTLDADSFRAHLSRAVKHWTATALSGSRRTASGLFRTILPLARRSQGRVGMLVGFGLASLFSTGCLVAEAPEYGPPRKTAPAIDMLSVDPPPFAVLQLRRPVVQPISLRIRSEDAGDGLVAFLYLDYLSSSHPDRDFIRAWPFPPATRELSMQWQVNEDITDGCHQLTLFLTHESNYDIGENTYKSPNDVDSITWWMNVDPAEDPNTLVGCPTPTDAPDDET
jgi:hypothetical protein